MSDGTTHPHSGYNKYELGTLVGNWVEETALEAATGDHRFSSWVPPADPNDTSIYAKRNQKPDFVPTNDRVFIHTITDDHQPFLTHNQTTYPDPAAASNACVKYLPTNKAGSRTDALMRQLMQEASVKEPVPEEKAEFVSTKMAHYTQHDMSGLNCGRRVMKTQDGEVLGLENRDSVWLAEAGLNTKDRVDRERMGPVDTSTLTGPYINDVPITIYTAACDHQMYPGSGSVMGTAVKSSNPFGKVTNFTKPISAYDKIVVNE